MSLIIALANQKGVAYLAPADNVSGPLSPRLRRANQPVINIRNLFSTPRPRLLADI
jgi:hypothetical protein